MAVANMAADIAIATVEAPSRRPNDVLPEHEQQFPLTDAARDLVAARYDGTSSTSKEIGNALGGYPSWRVQQIAAELGLYETKRAEIIERVRAEEAAPHNFNNRTTGKPVKSIEEAIATVSRGEQTTTRRMLREDLEAIAQGPRCRECGQVFERWRYFKGRLVTTGTCHACFSAKVKKPTSAPIAASAPEPEPSEQCADNSHAFCGGYNATGGKCNCSCHNNTHDEPSAETSAEPVYVPGPQFPMTFAPAASPAIGPAVLDLPLDDEDDDCELTFGDLPGNRIVFELLDLLPTSGRWTGRRRYRWLTALTATLDLLIDDDRDDETREEALR